MVASLTAAGIGLAGTLASSFLSNSGYDRQQAIENAAWSSALQHQNNIDLMNRQFELNKWFTQHGHQSEVDDLRKAGLNPILSANNGAYSQVGLPASGMTDVNAGQSALSQSKSSRMQAKAQNLQTVGNIANILADIDMKSSNSALSREQALTEGVRRENIATNTTLQNSEKVLNEINALWLPRKYKAEIRRSVVQNMVDVINAKSNRVIAGASARSAEANYINATSGNNIKVIMDLLRNPKQLKSMGLSWRDFIIGK